MTKIYTFTISAGGGGKTTITGNGGFYLAEKKNKRVLFIDEDQSCALTSVLTKPMADEIGVDHTEFLESVDGSKYSVKGIYEKKDDDPIPLKITDNISLIAGYSQLPDYEGVAGKNMGMSIAQWYDRNKEWIEANFDYILIDTHNDEAENHFLTSAFYASDVVVAVLPADNTVFGKIPILKERLELINSASRSGNKKFVVVGNKFLSNAGDPTESRETTKRFEELMAEEPETYLGYFKYRAKWLGAFKSSGIPITQKAKKKSGQSQSDKQFIEDCWKLMDKIFKY